MKKKFYFNPDAGKMNLEDKDGFRTHISKLRPRRHVMEIKEYHDTRTLGANSFYWVVVVKHFMEAMGLPDCKSNREYIHYDVLGQELRLIDDDRRPGEVRMQQTSTMDGSEFWKYIWKCEGLFGDFFAGGQFDDPAKLGYNTEEK